MYSICQSVCLFISQTALRNTELHVCSFKRNNCAITKGSCYIPALTDTKKNEVNPLTEILKCPTKVVLLRVSGVKQRVRMWKVKVKKEWGVFFNHATHVCTSDELNVCVCRTWWEEERWMKTWRLKQKRSVRNTAKSSSVLSLRWVIGYLCAASRCGSQLKFCYY